MTLVLDFAGRKRRHCTPRHELLLSKLSLALAAGGSLPLLLLEADHGRSRLGYGLVLV